MNRQKPVFLIRVQTLWGAPAAGAEGPWVQRGPRGLVLGFRGGEGQAAEGHTLAWMGWRSRAHSRGWEGWRQDSRALGKQGRARVLGGSGRATASPGRRPSALAGRVLGPRVGVWSCLVWVLLVRVVVVTSVRGAVRCGGQSGRFAEARRLVKRRSALPGPWGGGVLCARPCAAATGSARGVRPQAASVRFWG